MSPAAMVILTLVAMAFAFAIGHWVGWNQRAKHLPRPSVDEVAAYLDGVVEVEDYEARVRRNENMLRMAGRDSMPRGNSGPPARISKMRISKRDRRNP
jgi:hypothetical protein